MNLHYLDNSATTQVSEAAANKAMELMRENFANPSSLHSLGFEASKELTNARQTVAKAIGADSAEIYFTSGGSESNNLAIFGVAEAMKRRGNKIVTDAAEHSSVYDPMQKLKSMGFDVVFLKTDRSGKISIDEAFDEIDENTVLVSVMHTNNETGAVNPISDLSNIIKRKNSPAVLHCDAVQAFGKTPIKVAKLGVNLLTVSAHKIHGPKGVGALYVKKGTRLIPQHLGGKQEKELRGGTEAMPLIGAFGVAVSELSVEASHNRVKALNTYLREKLSEIEEITVNSPKDASPYILNFSTGVIRSETMLHHLSGDGVFVSSGSACSKGGKSRVLTSMGLPDEIIDTAIRVSFSKHSTYEDCDALTESLKNGLKNLARRK